MTGEINYTEDFLFDNPITNPQSELYQDVLVFHTERLESEKILHNLIFFLFIIGFFMLCEYKKNLVKKGLF